VGRRPAAAAGLGAGAAGTNWGADHPRPAAAATVTARASAGSIAAVDHPAAAVAAPSWVAHGGVVGADGGGGGRRPPSERPCRFAGAVPPYGTARSSTRGSASASVQSEKNCIARVNPRTYLGLKSGLKFVKNGIEN
jgi:hypothetical protein